MNQLDRLKELASKAQKVFPVEVMGETFYIRVISGADRDTFEASLLTKKGKKEVVSLVDVRGKLLAYCLSDAEGNQVCQFEKQATEISSLPISILEPLFEVAKEVNKIGKEDIDELKND